MSTGDVLAPEGRALAARMLEEVNDEQYTEYLQDPQVRANVGTLVLSAANLGMELSPATLDYAIENFGRHSLSKEEIAKIVGNIEELTPAEIEQRMRRVHLASELTRYELGPEAAQQSSTRGAEQRVEDISAISDVLEAIESKTHEELEVETVLELADQFKAFVYEGLTTNDDRGDLVGANSLYFMVDSDPGRVAEFLEARARTGRNYEIVFNNPNERKS